MGWVPLLMAVAGALSAADQERTQSKRNLAKAEGNRYAGIRNSRGQEQGGRQQLDFNAPSMLQGAISGGIGGLGAQQSMGGEGSWFGKGTSPIASTGDFSKVSQFGNSGISPNDGMSWSGLQADLMKRRV